MIDTCYELFAQNAITEKIIMLGRQIDPSRRIEEIILIKV